MQKIKSQPKNWQKAKVTRDPSANLKILKKLEKENFIEIYDVILEGGRENQKVKRKILPVGVWNHSRWDESVWADDDNVYNDLREILGKDKIKDAMQLETHIRNKFDYFVTEDNDFLCKREVLKEKFGVNIVTPNELQELYQQVKLQNTTFAKLKNLKCKSQN